MFLDAGAVAARAKALAAALDEVAMLPCDAKLTVSCLPLDAMVVGLQAINGEGPFQVSPSPCRVSAFKIK